MTEKAKYAVRISEGRLHYACTKHSDELVKGIEPKDVDITEVSGETWCEICIEKEREKRNESKTEEEKK